MRIIVLFYGLTVTIVFIVGIAGFGGESIFQKGFIDIKENFHISIFILFFSICSLMRILFFKYTGAEYLSGILAGLGFALVLKSSVGFGVIGYASLFNSLLRSEPEKKSNET